jgi:hypothetical protein
MTTEQLARRALSEVGMTQFYAVRGQPTGKRDGRPEQRRALPSPGGDCPCPESPFRPKPLGVLVHTLNGPDHTDQKTGL